MSFPKETYNKDDMKKSKQKGLSVGFFCGAFLGAYICYRYMKSKVGKTK